MKVYLDIETARDGRITVVGLYVPGVQVIQLVDSAVNPRALRNALGASTTVCTYNGERFDLPIIARQLGVDLRRTHRSSDLMYECWRQGLKGGLKRVEERLGIPRQTTGLSGLDAIRLWEEYRAGNSAALETLLLYNREDVVNLATLEQYLLGHREPCPPVEVPTVVLRTAFG